MVAGRYYAVHYMSQARAMGGSKGAFRRGANSTNGLGLGCSSNIWIEHRKTHWCVENERLVLYTQPGIRHLGHLSLQGVLALLWEEFENNKDLRIQNDSTTSLLSSSSSSSSSFILWNAPGFSLRIWKVIFHRSPRQHLVSYLQHICAPKNIGEICLAWMMNIRLVTDFVCASM